MIVFVLLSLVLFLIYIACVVKKYGVPPSLSRSYFSLQHKYWFTVTMFVCFALMLVPCVESMPDMWKFVAFITAASGFFIGAAPNLNEELENKVHMTGAIVLAIASQLMVWFLCPWFLICWICIVEILIRDGKNVKFWVEMVGGAILYAALLFHYIVI